MTLLYNRFAELSFPAQNRSIGGRRYIEAGEIIHPHSISFDVRFSSNTDPNDAEIKITNLDPDSQRALIQDDAEIELEAGYWPMNGTRLTGLIFKGKIRESNGQYENGVDHVTTIIATDSGRAFSNARTRSIFPAGTSHETIVNALAQSMADEEGVELGSIRVPAFNETRPRTVDRISRRELDDICHQHDLQWFITDGVLNVFPRSETLTDTEYDLSPETGLIGVPEFNDKGVNLDTLLIHDLRPGLRFVVNSELRQRLRNVCKIEEVNFSGSNHDGRFGCSINAKVIEQSEVRRSSLKRVGMIT